MSELCQKETHAPQQNGCYSITSSARESIVGGIVIPSDFAVLSATPLLRSSKMTRWVCQAEPAGARKVLPELIDARAPWVMPLQRQGSR
jgi:hypothetical protein